MSLSGDFDTHVASQVKVNLWFLDVFQAECSPTAPSPANPDIGLRKKAIGQRLGYSGADLRKNVDQAGVQIPK